MANTVFKLRRSSVAGKTPNTSTLAIGELALNLTDRKLYSSDGTNVWETGANLTTLSVSTNTTVNNVIFSGGIYANGYFGSAGQVLTSNSTGVYWSSAAGGGGGALPIYFQYTGDGSTTSFLVAGGYTPNYISVYLNGVLLRNGIDVDVTSGVNIVITPAPENGSLIDVIGVSSVYSTGINVIVSQQFTANGTSNSFAITDGYVANQVQVFLNGVKQIPVTDVDITSGTNVNFISTPANGFIVDVYGIQSAVALSSSVLTVGSNVTISSNSISVGNSSVNTQIVAGNVFLNGSTLVIGNTSSNVTINSTAISVGTIQLNTSSYAGTANNTSFVGTVSAANVVSNAQLSSNLSNYQTTAGLSGNVATLTANNTSFVGSVSAANVVSNAQLSANLSNYAALSGATFSNNVVVNGNITVSGTVVGGSSLSMRNRIINGDMRIWQRGTTFTNPIVSGAFYTADRMGVNRAGDVTGATVSRSTSAPTAFQYSLNLQRTAGNTGTQGLFLFYSAETIDSIGFASKNVTFSFYAKAGANYSGGPLSVIVNTGTGTDERVYAYTGSATVIAATQAINTTWTRYTFTTSSAVASNITEIGFYIYWTPSGTAGADDAVYLTGIQLEEGSVATAFERRYYGQELALCQRYYNKYNFRVAGWATSATVTRTGYTFPQMRAAPSITDGESFVQYGPGGQQTPSFSFSNIEVTTTQIDATIGGGMTTNHPTLVGGYHNLSAEL